MSTHVVDPVTAAVVCTSISVSSELEGSRQDEKRTHRGQRWTTSSSLTRPWLQWSSRTCRGHRRPSARAQESMSANDPSRGCDRVERAETHLTGPVVFADKEDLARVARHPVLVLDEEPLQRGVEVVRPASVKSSAPGTERDWDADEDAHEVDVGQLHARVREAPAIVGQAVRPVRNEVVRRELLDVGRDVLGPRGRGRAAAEHVTAELVASLPGCSGENKSVPWCE